jgi:hypothetical protein
MPPSPRQVWQQLARSTWLFFPFTSAPVVHDDKDKDAQQQSSGHNRQLLRATSSGTGSSEASSDPDRSPRSPLSPLPLPPLPVELDTNAAIALAFLLGSATTLGASIVYRRFFRRIRSAEWITPDLLGRKRWITGVVTRCVVLVFPHRSLIQVNTYPGIGPVRARVFIYSFLLYLVRTAWVMRIISAFTTPRVSAGAVYSSSDMCRLPGEVRDHFTYPHPQI